MSVNQIFVTSEFSLFLLGKEKITLPTKDAVTLWF